MATKRRSRKDLYARLISYVNDCLMQARIAITAASNEDEYIAKEFKKDYQRQLRRVEKKLEDVTSNIVRWKDAIKNVDLEYLIQLNALYAVMKSEFEYFDRDSNMPIMAELQKEIDRCQKIVRMNPKKNVYEKTMDDYCQSITDLAYAFKAKNIFRRARARKYGLFDVHAWNVEMRALYGDTEITSNEVFNSYKLDSLTKKRSFTYIKTLVNIAFYYQTSLSTDFGESVYLMSYTTPSGMVSFKMDLSTFDIFAEIRFYNREAECGYQEAKYNVDMQTDLYKLYESFGFSQRQRRDASLKYARICELIEKYDAE